MRLAVAEVSATRTPARHRLTAQARDGGLKSPFVDVCAKVAAGAGGNSGMLVEDRHAISERYARSMPVLYRGRPAERCRFRVIMGGRDQRFRTRDYVCMFCSSYGSRASELTRKARNRTVDRYRQSRPDGHGFGAP